MHLSALILDACLWMLYSLLVLDLLSCTMTFFVFYLDFFLSLPCLIRILVPQHSFCFHLHAIFFSLTFSQCVLSSKENLCEQHNDGSSFLFSQPSYVFWLEHLVYWCLKLLLIGTNIAILLPVFWLLLQFFSVLSFISRLTCGLIIFFSVTFGLSP